MTLLLKFLATASLMLSLSSHSLFGQITTKTEATTVAKNWISLIIEMDGSWGEYDTARIKEITELTNNGKLLGYFSHVDPQGFVAISLRRELAPVKCYSTNSSIDPDSNEGMTGYLKESMERILVKIEEQLGPVENIQHNDLTNLLEIDYTNVWKNLENNTLIENKDNYQQGTIMLSTNWHQGEPYNDHCPDMGCNNSCNSNNNAVVGCVATAGAQIMRYWNWPPSGEGAGYSDTYDWLNMPDGFTGCSWNVFEVFAVAELCYEVGFAAGMNYGCNGSGTNTDEMEDVYEDNYRYHSSCNKKERSDYSAIGWFELMKQQFNINRPIQYRIPGHSVVADGWRETGFPVVREYHINYGHATSSTTWYILDAILGGNPNEEYMLISIVPDCALGSAISGFYGKEAYPYRYVDQDATGSNATFSSGQYIQFLPEISVSGNGSSNSVRFYGSTTDITRLYSNADTTEGAKISGGAIKLTNGGGIKIY